MRNPAFFLSATLCSALSLVCSATAATLTGKAEIIDGDTLSIGAVVVRISGIDAAELGQSCALPRGGNWNCTQAAADRLAELTTGKDLVCDALGNDPYGRILATCFADGVDVGGQLVGEGLAWAFVRYSDVYVDTEARARAAGIGVWQAETQAPWDYRADRWERAAEASPRPGCPIKGNIAKGGEHIYHTPWSPWYSRTRIDEAQGERWFCDEAEAGAAGWRAAHFR